MDPRIATVIRRVAIAAALTYVVVVVAKNNNAPTGEIFDDANPGEFADITTAEL